MHISHTAILTCFIFALFSCFKFCLIFVLLCCSFPQTSSWRFLSYINCPIIICVMGSIFIYETVPLISVPFRCWVYKHMYHISMYYHTILHLVKTGIFIIVQSNQFRSVFKNHLLHIIEYSKTDESSLCTTVLFMFIVYFQISSPSSLDSHSPPFPGFAMCADTI